jgi:iron complex transport system permease protein
MMQTVFSNPLAGPYILGISSGAGLGVALAIMASAGTGLALVKNLTTISAAWAGSFIFLIIIMLVAIRVRHVLTVLIIGVILGSITSSVINLLQYFTDSHLLKNYVIWSMGSFSSVTKTQIPYFFLSVFGGIIIALLSSKGLNSLLLGEEYARTLGININSNRILVFISVSLLAGTSTAYCGPIGFIGIIIPHIARWMIKSSDHRKLIVISGLTGACFMLICDIIANRPEFNGVIPINTISSILGIPILFYLIIKKHKLFIN